MAAIAPEPLASSVPRGAPAWSGWLVMAVVALVCGLLMVRVLEQGLAPSTRDPVAGAPLLFWRPAASRVSLAGLPVISDPSPLSVAQRRLETCPYDVEALTALAALSVQDRGRQARLVRQISRLTRRSTPAEVWLLQDGWQSGRHVQAMRSLDLLLRRRTVSASGPAFALSWKLDQPAARRALATTLLQQPGWAAGFLLDLSRSAPLQSIDALMLELARRGGQPDDRALELVLRRHIAEGDYSGARRLWSRNFPPSDGGNLVYDGGFDGLPGPAPFNWQIAAPTGSASVSKRLPGGAASAVNLRHDLFGQSAPMISQIVFLPAGEFDLAVRAQGLAGQADRRFRLDLFCVQGLRLLSLPLTIETGAWRSTGSRFKVPARDCPAQSVRIRPVTGDRSQAVEIRIDEIAIRASRARGLP